MRTRPCRNSFPNVLWLPVLILVALSPSSIGAEAHHRDESPDIVLGVSTGFADHFGKSNQIDVVTGASEQIPKRKRNDPGGSVGLFADFGFVRAGPVDFGLGAAFWISFPDLYFDISAIPRFRLLLDTRAKAIPRVEPWLGFLATFAFHERFSSDYFFMIGGSLGCDLSISDTNWVVGMAVHTNVANLVPVEETVTLDGQPIRLEHRLDAVFAVVNVGYRVF